MQLTRHAEAICISQCLNRELLINNSKESASILPDGPKFDHYVRESTVTTSHRTTCVSTGSSSTRWSTSFARIRHSPANSTVSSRTTKVRSPHCLTVYSAQLQNAHRQVPCRTDQVPGGEQHAVHLPAASHERPVGCRAIPIRSEPLLLCIYSRFYPDS